MVTFPKRFAFGSKAETLERLRPHLRKSVVPDFVYFPVAAWSANAEELIAKVCGRFAHDEVIVRSSALAEDGEYTAMAGFFQSVPHVAGDDFAALRDAVEAVAASYRRDRANDSPCLSGYHPHPLYVVCTHFPE